MKLLLSALVVFTLCPGTIAQPPRKTPAPTASQPVPDSQLYRNPTFGFRYRIPYGWVDRTQEMQDGNDAAKGEVLVAIFERPPQASGNTVNSAVVIAAEKATAYPGLKKAEDYLAPLSELTTAQGFKVEGDPTEAEISGQRLVRVDFSKALNDKLTMHQSTLVLLSKGQIVSFTFLAESMDAVDDLIDGISFAAPKSKAK